MDGATKSSSTGIKPPVHPACLDSRACNGCHSAGAAPAPTYSMSKRWNEHTAARDSDRESLAALEAYFNSHPDAANEDIARSTASELHHSPVAVEEKTVLQAYIGTYASVMKEIAASGSASVSNGAAAAAAPAAKSDTGHGPVAKDETFLRLTATFVQQTSSRLISKLNRKLDDLTERYYDCEDGIFEPLEIVVGGSLGGYARATIAMVIPLQATLIASAIAMDHAALSPFHQVTRYTAVLGMMFFQGYLLTESFYELSEFVVDVGLNIPEADRLRERANDVASWLLVFSPASLPLADPGIHGSPYPAMILAFLLPPLVVFASCVYSNIMEDLWMHMDEADERDAQQNEEKALQAEAEQAERTKETAEQAEVEKARRANESAQQVETEAALQKSKKWADDLFAKLVEQHNLHAQRFKNGMASQDSAALVKQAIWVHTHETLISMGKLNEAATESTKQSLRIQDLERTVSELVDANKQQTVHHAKDLGWVINCYHESIKNCQKNYDKQAAKLRDTQAEKEREVRNYNEDLYDQYSKMIEQTQEAARQLNLMASEAKHRDETIDRLTHERNYYTSYAKSVIQRATQAESTVKLLEQQTVQWKSKAKLAEFIIGSRTAELASSQQNNSRLIDVIKPLRDEVQKLQQEKWDLQEEKEELQDETEMLGEEKRNLEVEKQELRLDMCALERDKCALPDDVNNLKGFHEGLGNATGAKAKWDDSEPAQQERALPSLETTVPETTPSTTGDTTTLVEAVTALSEDEEHIEDGWADLADEAYETNLDIEGQLELV